MGEVKKQQKKIGRLLAEARKKSGLTQGEVAKYLGYTTAQQVSNMERDASPVPFNTVVKLCDLYKLSKKRVMDALIDDYRDKVNAEFQKSKPS